jgi:hypothetical protein
VTEAAASSARCCSLGFERMTVVFEEQPAT